MANFAKIDSDNMVIDILSSDYEFIEVLKEQNPDFTYIEYSDDNYASPGYPYNPEIKKFLLPKPYYSWVLNEEKWEFEAPVPMPNDGKYYSWDEMELTWVEVTPVV